MQTGVLLKAQSFFSFFHCRFRWKACFVHAAALGSAFVLPQIWRSICWPRWTLEVIPHGKCTFL